MRLDHFLKSQGFVSTGGQAKLVIQDEAVLVNGQIETRRRRQLQPGDIVQFEGQELSLDASQQVDAPPTEEEPDA